MNTNHIKCYAFMLLLIKKERKSSFLQRQSLEYSNPQHTCMITLYYENDNIFTQDSYDKIIDQLDFLTLECPSCKHSGCLIKHAKYPRTFRMSNSNITVNIVRVLCKECGHTHAILLCDFVPYSQILLSDQLDILQSDNDEEFLSENPNFDLSDIRYIKKQFNLYWKQRLISHSISLECSLFISCFQFFSRQFMQIKTTINSLQHVTHIRFF